MWSYHLAPPTWLNDDCLALKGVMLGLIFHTILKVLSTPHKHIDGTCRGYFLLILQSICYLLE